METQTVELPKTPPAGAAVADEGAQRAAMAAHQPIQRLPSGRPVTPDASDENLMVEFFKGPLDAIDYIKIRIPGDNLYQPVFLATEGYQRRFPAQWEAYVNEQSQFVGQTLLTECGWVDEGLRDHLAVYGIKTIEGLASVSDGNLEMVGPGARLLRDRARREVEEKEKAAEYDVKNAEVETLRAEMESVRAEMAELRDARRGGAGGKRAGANPAA